ncbi:hypothetical protein [Xanthobacter agilis]|uniref:hypothetical protein n=1 Tax=Xanthobacter agilis TaxID=47492 RepID=UPI0037263D9D
MTFTRRPMTPDEEKAGHDFIAKFQEKARRRAALRKAGVPQVAIFWVTKVLGKFEFLSQSTPWPEAEQAGENWVEKFAHHKEWDSRKAMYKLEGGWTDWPRGRVNYNQPSGLLTVFADPQLLTPYYRNRILRKFSLPAGTTRFQRDPHYDAKLQIPPTLGPSNEDPAV